MALKKPIDIQQFAVGQLLALALYNGPVVDAYFTLAFCKHLLGISVGLSDLESVDPEWMLENNIDSIFELTFSVEADDFGSTRIVDLKPGGQEIPDLLSERSPTTTDKRNAQNYFNLLLAAQEFLWKDLARFR
ncbi:hypothetical protein PCANC_27184, partial [Puccinia coronata f. sp. avenae]